MIDVDAAGKRLIVVAQEIEGFRTAFVTLCQTLLRIEG